MATLLADLGPWGTTRGADGRIATEITRAAQWLRLAAGLDYVDIDTAFGHNDDYMCNWGVYDDAANLVAAQYITEQTRLHYTWNGFERLLKTIDLPRRSGVTGTFNEAALLMAENPSCAEPEHYVCTLSHFSWHIRSDREWTSSPRVLAAITPAEIKPQRSLLMLAANQLRHPIAHGDFSVPEPPEWGEEDSIERLRQLPSYLHALRLAVRGLLLSIPILLAAAPDRLHLTGQMQPEPGWWLKSRNGPWGRTNEPDPASLLMQAGLATPCGETIEYEEDWEKDDWKHAIAEISGHCVYDHGQTTVADQINEEPIRQISVNQIPLFEP